MLPSSPATHSALIISPTPTPIINEFIIASANVTEDDVTVNISARLPINGGLVTGSVSGFCEGSLQGTYDGQENGKISGTLNGTCGYFILKTAATATFTGVVHKSTGEIPITYTAKAENNTEAGSVVLKFKP